MTSATINRWCYAFDDDRSPPVTKKPAQPIDAHVFVVPAPHRHHCTYCHTVLQRSTKGIGVCDEDACSKKHQRDRDIQRLDRAQQAAGGGIVQRGKNRQ